MKVDPPVYEQDGLLWRPASTAEAVEINRKRRAGEDPGPFRLIRNQVCVWVGYVDRPKPRK